MAMFAGVLLLSIVILILSFRMFMGSLSAHQAQLFLDDWQAKKGLSSEQAYTVAREAAQSSIRWYPVNNGAYWQRLGQIDEWRYYTRPFGDTLASPTRQSALNAYREAVTYKQQWPYLWARYANVKLQLREWDDELMHALQQINATGPWRPLASRDLVEIGFLAWPALNTDMQTLVLNAADRTLSASRHFAQDVQATAQHAGMTATLCDYLSNNARDTQQFCQ